jgi:hypothetical protein
VSWLPPDGEDAALWRIVHDDGDTEDMDEDELTVALNSALHVDTSSSKPNPLAQMLLAGTYLSEPHDLASFLTPASTRCFAGQRGRSGLHHPETTGDMCKYC